MPKPVVIEVGPQTVRVAQLSDRRGQIRVIRFAERELPEGYRWDIGGDRAPVVQAVREAMTAAAIHARSAIFSLSRGQVTARVSAFPPVEGEQLRRVVTYELADHIPFPLEEVVLDLQKLGPSQEQPDMVEVLVVAAPKELIHEQTRLAQDLGLRVHAITVDALALEDLARLTGREPTGVSVVLDIGARSTTINLSQGGALQLTRTAGTGTNLLLRALQEDLGLSAGEALEQKDAKLAGLLAQSQPGCAVRGWLEGLVGEIRRSALSFGPQRISRVLLIGAEAGDPALAYALAEALGAEGSCLTAAQAFPQVEFWGSDPPTANRCLPAIAAGLQSIGKSAWSISLLPAELQQQRRIQLVRRLAWGGAAVVVVLLALWYLSLTQRAEANRAKTTVLKKELAAVEKRQQKLASVVTERDALQQQASTLSVLTIRKYEALELLRAAALYAPNEVVLTDFVLRPEQPLELRGTAPDSATVAKLQQLLGENPLVTEASLSSIDRAVSRQKISDRLSFTMRLKLWLEPKEETEARSLRSRGNAL